MPPAGTGSISQLVGEWIKSRPASRCWKCVQGVNAEIPDLLAGVVMAAYVVPQVIVTHVKAGKLRALAVAGPSLLAMFPAVPTTAEAGLPGVRAIAWKRHLRSRGTRRRDQILHRELVRATTPRREEPGARHRSEVAGDTPEEFAAFVRSESAQVEQGHPRCEHQAGLNQAAPDVARDPRFLAGVLDALAVERILRHLSEPAPSASSCPFGAGGPDTVARLMAQALAARTGQPFVVDNLPARTASSAPKPREVRPDGYTLLLTSSSSSSIASMYKKLPYDTLRDFTPVTQVTAAGGLRSW